MRKREDEPNGINYVKYTKLGDGTCILKAGDATINVGKTVDKGPRDEIAICKAYCDTSDTCTAY
jgi:hypothetical protein